MVGNANPIHVSVQRPRRTLVLVIRFQVEGVDVTHAACHEQINQLLGRFASWGWRGVVSFSEQIACTDTKEAAGGELDKSTAIEIVR